MRAILSDRLRKIISDPKRNKTVLEEISRLQTNAEHVSRSPVVTMDEHKYKVRLIPIELPH